MRSVLWKAELSKTNWPKITKKIQSQWHSCMWNMLCYNMCRKKKLAIFVNCYKRKFIIKKSKLKYSKKKIVVSLKQIGIYVKSRILELFWIFNKDCRFMYMGIKVNKICIFILKQR